MSLIGRIARRRARRDNRPALFVAGSYSQAAYWARQLGFGHREWQYVTAKSSRGYMHPTVYVVGTPDEEVMLALAPAEPTLIYAEEMLR